MRWVVDGMNVIGSRPTGWWRDRAGATGELVARLRAFADRSGERVSVVFDGRPVAVEGADRVEVLFASRRGRDAADGDIAALVERDAAPAGLRVVTSDGALAARVRELGAEVEGAGAFRRRLDEG